MNAEELKTILAKHGLWCESKEGGQRAYLQGADLRGAYLQGADLRGAYLQGAYLQGAYLQRADLQGADLQGAYLRGAYLRGADLQGADLRGAYLRGAYLQGADLRGADLQGADLQGAYLRGADSEKIIIEKNPICITGLRWDVTIWDNHMQIGCEFHSHADWASFDSDRISKMDSEALDFWDLQKDLLMQICNSHRPVEVAK